MPKMRISQNFNAMGNRITACDSRAGATAAFGRSLEGFERSAIVRQRRRLKISQRDTFRVSADVSRELTPRFFAAGNEKPEAFQSSGFPDPIHDDEGGQFLTVC